MIRIAAIALLSILLAGCPMSEVKSDAPPQVVQLPTTVTKVVKEYVPIPEELTRDCYDETAKEQTNAEALRLALLRKEVLAACSADKRRIRALSGKAVKP